MADTALLAPSDHFVEPIAFDIAELRHSIRNRNKVSFGYRNAISDVSERTVRLLSLVFSGPSWSLAA